LQSKINLKAFLEDRGRTFRTRWRCCSSLSFWSLLT